MTMSADLENTLLLTLETGPVTIKLRPDLAPNHVERIKELAAKASMTAWSSTA
jgi:peptidylprolyl isomerase